MVAATAGHWIAFTQRLRDAGFDVDVLLEQHMLTYVDAEHALERILVGGYPDAERFDAVLGSVVRDALRFAEHTRVFGELVNILWTRVQYPAAIRLEQLWHRLLSELPFSLFCAYNIDVFDTGFDTSLLDALLRAHSHLLPNDAGSQLVDALNAALEEVAGKKRAASIVREAGDFSRRGWPSLPRTEAVALWLRQHMPREAPDVFRRAKAMYRATSSTDPVFSAESAT